MEESFPNMLETLGSIPAASKRKIDQISLLEYKSLFYISWLLYKKTGSWIGWVAKIKPRVQQATPSITDGVCALYVFHNFWE